MFFALKIALLALLLLGSLVCCAVIWFLRAVAKSIQSAPAPVNPPPCRVTLEPDSNPQWLKPGIITGYANELRALGFEEVGAFQIPELGGLKILGLIHPGEGLLSVIYDHNRAPAPTFDICADFTDGSTVSATNSAAGNALDKQPGHPILWLGNVSAHEILEAVKTLSATAPRQPIHKSDFVEHFKKAYARSINWRLKKGGASRDEIRRQAEKKGQNLSDEQLEACYQSLHQTYLRQLQAGCIAQHLDDQKPPAAAWERIRSRAFAVAETMKLDEIIEIISAHVELNADQRQQLESLEISPGADAVAVMENILIRNLAGPGLKSIGEVTEPVHALILLASEPAAPVAIPETVVH
jgi:hypothetical protein